MNNTEIPTSGRDAITFGTNNLNPEIVEFLHKNNKKMIIEKASNKELELLADANFTHPKNIRASLDHDAITHILKRHGVNSVNVKNGEIPITNDDIANYRYIVNNADAIIRTIDKYNKEAITAFKQVNGYAVVVEQAINKKNELALKTMFKSKGDYKNNEVYKEFSSTSLNANAKVPYRLSSYSGAKGNTTKESLTSQAELLKTQETTLKTQEATQKTQDLSPLEQANAEKLAKLESDKLESALFFKQISQYAKGLRLKILSAPISKKDLARLKKLKNAINQEEERLKGKDLNTLEQEILKEQENALKLKESIKAKQNYTETLKNAINQKEQAKNLIEQQKQNLESQRNEKEREKQNQEHDKRNKEQERNELNDEIEYRGNERVTLKQLGTSWDFLGIQPYLNNNGRGRTYAKASFRDTTKAIREHYEIETKIKNILGFYRIGESDERILHRFLELSQRQQDELARLLLQ
ncbi:hypothetical protein ID0050_08690 [Helicobacter pylori]